MENEKTISNGKLFFIIFILIIVGIILWARFVSTKGLIVKEYPIYNENINESFDGFKIIHFSDLLYGRTVNKNDVKKLVQKINDINPDIVVFTGDLVDKDTLPNKSLTKFLTTELSKIEPKLGKFTILGDQDKKLEDYEIIMKNAGFTFLNNSYELIYYNSTTPIMLAGFPSYLKDTHDNETTLSYIKEHPDERFYKIVLTHEPDSIDDFKEYNVDLVLSGHSLNGQIRIPYVGAIKTKKGSKKYFDNYYKINNTDLYISSGIGTSDYSFRWFNKPSINFYRLYKK